MYNILNDLHEKETGKTLLLDRPTNVVYEEKDVKNEALDVIPERVLYVTFGVKYAAPTARLVDAKRHAKIQISRNIFGEFINDIHHILDYAYAGDMNSIINAANKIINKIDGKELTNEH